MGPKSLYSATPLVFNSPDGVVPLGRYPQNFYQKVTNDQGTKRRRNIVENFNRLSREHKRYTDDRDRRQTTDGRMTDGIASSRSLESTDTVHYLALYLYLAMYIKYLQQFCTVVQNCCKGDEPCQWNTPIFRPSGIENP